MNDDRDVRYPPRPADDDAELGTTPTSDTVPGALPWTLIRRAWVRSADARSIGIDVDRRIDAERSIVEMERRAA